MLNAVRFAIFNIVGAEHTLLRRFAVCRRHNCAERAEQNAGKATYAFIFINYYHSLVGLG